MFRIKAVLVAAALVAVSSTTAHAQQPQGGPEARGMRQAPTAVVDRWLDGITLAPAQQAAIDSTKKKYDADIQAMRTEMRAAMQAGTGDRQAMMQKNRELTDRMAADIRSLVPEAQRPAFDKNREAVEAQRRERMQRNPGGGQRSPR